jgi:nucleoside phosphorylase
MKILILDDEPRRYPRLITALAAQGIDRGDIELVACVDQARHSMAATQFDLLIIDILIPNAIEGDPDVRHSLDLLMDIRESDQVQKPGYILGITADPEATGEALAQLEAWTWAVLEYSDSNDEWVSKAANCARYIQHGSQTEDRPTVDLAIVCALAKPELEEVLKLPWNWSAPRPISDTIFVHDGSVEVDGQLLKICASYAPRMGMVSTALHSAAILSALRPKIIAMCGICAGVRGKVNLGDVLFADPAWDFQSGKRISDGTNSQFSMRPHQLQPPAKVRAHVEQIRDDRDGLARISAAFGTDAPGTTRVFLGPVASGSAVLADGEVIKEIKSQHQELIGVEMEIYGLYAAAHCASSPPPLFLALKGVCDFADHQKADGQQRYAAYASAGVLRLLIERFGQRLLA